MDFDPSKAKSIPVSWGLAELGLEPAGTLKEGVARIQKHYEGRTDLNQCDNCGGWSSADDLEMCPFCGVGEDAPAPEAPPMTPDKPPKQETPKMSTAIVPAAAPLVTAQEKLLDEAVADFKKLNSGFGKTSWGIAQKLTQIYESDLWKARRNEKGEVAYKTFEDFTRAELGIGRKYAQNLMRICANFTEADLIEHGTSKLQLVVSAPAEMREQLLEEVKAGASKRQIAEKAQKPRPGKSMKKPAKGEKREPTITIASIVGTKNVPMYKTTKALKSGTAKPADLVPAKAIADVPWCMVPLENDVTMYIMVLQGANGNLTAKVQFKREEAKK